MGARTVLRCAAEIRQRLEVARSHLDDFHFGDLLERVGADLLVWEASFDRFTVTGEVESEHVLDS